MDGSEGALSIVRCDSSLLGSEAKSKSDDGLID